MASLLDLTAQGDVGTITDESKLGSIQLMSPQQLYELWERQPWSSHEIDFEADRADWAALDSRRKEVLSWFLSSFFVGEERVTTQFAGLVMAYEDQSEEAFLATQQVDEARHAQHFNNLYREVLGRDGDFEARLARAREDLNDAFVELFDGVLVDAGRRLIVDPSDTDAKIDFVTTYHMIIEGTLALTGQHFLTDFLEREDLMPGFRTGFRLVSRDEHRHVAYGTWYLQQACREDPARRERVARRLMELIPTAANVFIPPSGDVGDYELLGYTFEQTNEFAYLALNRRLKVIGIDLAAAGSGAPASPTAA